MSHFPSCNAGPNDPWDASSSLLLNSNLSTPMLGPRSTTSTRTHGLDSNHDHIQNYGDVWRLPTVPAVYWRGLAMMYCGDHLVTDLDEFNLVWGEQFQLQSWLTITYRPCELTLSLWQPTANSTSAAFCCVKNDHVYSYIYKRCDIVHSLFCDFVRKVLMNMYHTAAMNNW